MFDGGRMAVNLGRDFVSTIARLRHWPRRLAGAFASALLPPTCCLCGFPGMRAGFDLCEICLGLLPANVAETSHYPSIFSRAVVPYEYAYPVDRFIRALKFRGERVYARLLGVLLADARRRTGAPLPQVLIPVPLHPSRYRARGFNQAHEIARFAAGQLGVRVDAGCLTRVIATHEQSALSLVDRQRNVRGVFHLACPPRVQHVALVDDVLTTGNTVAEAADVLKNFGIADIELWCTARAVLRKDFFGRAPWL